jgi:hypothetical protein
VRTGLVDLGDQGVDVGVELGLQILVVQHVLHHRLGGHAAFGVGAGGELVTGGADAVTGGEQALDGGHAER